MMLDITRQQKSGDVMRGFPPDPATRVSADNWHEAPYLRWSLMNRGRLVRTVPVWRGDGPVLELPVAAGAGGSGIFDGGFESRLLSLEIDGLLVLKHGKIIHETYLHGMQPQTQHSLASISKSYLAVLAAILADAGEIELTAPAERYVPEFKDSSMRGATLQQILDMQVGIMRPTLSGRSDGVGQRDGGVFEIIGLMPMQQGSISNFYELVLNKPASGPHGQTFYYDNGPAEALAWILKRVTSMTLSDLMSNLLFQHLGLQRDGLYSIDNTGAEFASGGLATTLRDLARFGEMLRCGGCWNGRQVVPEAFIRDAQVNGRQDIFRGSRFAPSLPTGSYRNYFFSFNDEHGSFMASGRYGQRLYISPKQDLVIAQVASSPGISSRPFETEYVQLLEDIARAVR